MRNALAGKLLSKEKMSFITFKRFSDEATMNKRFNVPKKVVVGGTFDILHAGHKALLRKAYELVEEDKSSSLATERAKRSEGGKERTLFDFAAARAGGVLIGLTSDAMARKRKRRKIEDFKYRKKELEGFVRKEFNIKPKIVKIEDKFGPTLEEDFDYIVVSPETYKTALLINKERQKRNKKPIKIVKINFTLAKDKKPIFSTRIFKGEIDRDGNLLRYKVC